MPCYNHIHLLLIYLNLYPADQDYYCSKTDKRWEKEYRSAGNKEEWLQAKIAKYAAINEVRVSFFTLHEFEE